MTEHDLERNLGEWMHEPRPAPSEWVLESVVGHARGRSNQPWWRHLPGHVASRALDRWAAARSPLVGRHPLLARVTASTALMAALLLVAVLLLPSLTPERQTQPAFEPACPPSPAVPLPDTPLAPGAPTGLTGSVWLAGSAGGPDSHITLHPDGTIVQRVKGSGTPIGLGIWQPTGGHSLSSVVVFLDADPVKHVRYGVSTYRAEWRLDDAGESASLTWRATVQPGDGSAPSEASGSASLTRLHPLPLPEGAKYPLPTASAWALGIGSTGQAPGSGRVASIQVPCDCNDLAPDYMIVHDDGTIFIAGDAGNGDGLWVASGPATSALTAWSHTGGPNLAERWVGELSGWSLLAGRGDALDQHLAAAPRRIEPMSGESLPEVDPALWPETGSVWLPETADGTALVAFLADGTAIAQHRRYGTGAGYWQPIDADTVASSVSFAETGLQDYHLRARATIEPGGQTVSMSYQLVERNSGSEETGDMTATRLRLDP